MKKRILLGVIIIALFLSTTRASAQTVDEILFADVIEDGAKFSWEITKLTTDDDKTEWDWRFAGNFTLTEGDKIEIEWIGDPPTKIANEMSGPINYTNMEVTVGGTLLNASADETWFNFFIIPLYIRNDLGDIEDMKANERVFATSCILPYSDLPTVQGYTWQIDITNATMGNTGNYASSDDSIGTLITTHDYFDTLEPEAYVFEGAYNARTGVLRYIKYPSTVIEGGGRAGNSTDGVTEGLDALEIEAISKAAPGFEAPIVITGLFAVAAIAVVLRRRR
jgi:hypothetical protein